MEPTGITALDKILGGGLPRPSGIGLFGPMGSGKSILAKQIAAYMLASGFTVLFYAIDQPSIDIKQDLESIDVNVEKYEREESLSFVDIFSIGANRVKDSYIKHEPGESILQSGLQFSDLVEKGREFTLKNIKRKQLVILDSITPLFLMSDTKAVFQYCQTLKYATRFANAIGIAINHSGVIDERLENAFYGFTDGLIELKKSSKISSGPIIGTISVNQMKGQNFLKGNYYYEVKGNKIDISTVTGIV